MSKFSMFISPMKSFEDVQNTLKGFVQKIGDYIANLPPKTDMQNNRVTSVGDPVQPTDAVNLRTVQSAIGIVTSTQGGGGGLTLLNPSVALGTIAWKVSVSPWATITAPGGAITFSAGGTNQNIVLSPSGTGTTIAQGPGNTPFIVTGQGTGNTTLPINSSQGHAASVSFQNAGAFEWYVGNVASNSNSLEFINSDGSGNSTRVILNQGGSLALGSTNPNYTLDVTGDINASGTYRAGGVAGFTGTTTYLKSISNIGTVITSTFGTSTYSVGILTGRT